MTCPLCRGSGMIAVGPWGARPQRKTCPACNGVRTVPEDSIPQIEVEYRI